MIKNTLKQNIVFSTAIILSVIHAVFAYFVFPSFSAFYAKYSHPLPLSIRFLEEWRLLLPVILVILVAHHLFVKPTPKKFWILIMVATALCALLFLFPALVFIPMWTGEAFKH